MPHGCANPHSKVVSDKGLNPITGGVLQQVTEVEKPGSPFALVTWYGNLFGIMIS